MTDPKKYLTNYLWKLIERYAKIKLYKKQLDILDEWKGHHRIETLNKGASFFKLVEASFKRTMLVELCLFVSEKEQKNIFDWLNKAKTHSKSLNPTSADKDDKNGYSRLAIKDADYKKVIEKQISRFSAHSNIIKNLVAHRDKIFTHYDSSYFNNPNTIFKKYSIDIFELDSLMKTIEEILSTQHSYLFASSIPSFEVASYSNVNMILAYTRAFMRIRKDKKLIIGKGFKPADYLKEIYLDSEKA